MNLLRLLLFSQYNKLIQNVNGTQPLNSQILQGFHESQNLTEQYSRDFSKFLSSKRRFLGSRMFRTIFWTFRWRWLFVILSKVVLTFLLVLAPVLTNKMLHLAKEKNTENLLILLLLILLQKGIKTFLSVHVNFQQIKIGCLLYGQLALQIYDKPMDNTGRMLSLLEEDSYRMINLAYFTIELLFIPIQICYSVYVLCWTIKIEHFNIHFVIFSLYLLLCIFLAAIEKMLNSRLMACKDNRNATVLKVMQRLQQTSVAVEARTKELRIQSWLFTVEIVGRTVASILCSVILVVSLVTLSGNITQSQMFSLILLFNELRYPCTLFPSILSNFLQNYVAVCRVEQTLFGQQTHLINGSILTEDSLGVDPTENDQIDLCSNSGKMCISRRVINQLYQYHFGQYCIPSVSIEENNEPDARYHLLMCLAQQVSHTNRIVIDHRHYTQIKQYFGSDAILNNFNGSFFTPQGIHVQNSDSQVITVYRQVAKEYNQQGTIHIKTVIEYAKISGIPWLLVLFVLSVVVSQCLSVYSSVIYRRESSQKQLIFQIDSILFVVPFATVVPTVLALSSILLLSWRSSKMAFFRIMNRIQELLHKFKITVMSNRLTNDLKFYDRSVALFLYDIVNSSCALMGTLFLCCFSLIHYGIVWLSVVLAFLLVLLLVMGRWNRVALRTIRQCLRCQAAYRSKSIKQLCNYQDGLQAVKYLGISKQLRKSFINSVDKIVQTHIVVTSLETWMQVRLLMLSLVACWMLSGVCIVAQMPADVIGIILAYSLTLDDMIQGWFLSRVNVQKCLVAVQRILDLL